MTGRSQLARRAGLIGLAIAAGHLAVSGLLIWATTTSLAAVAAPGPAPLDAGLGLCAAFAAWAVLTWLSVVALLALAAAALPRFRTARWVLDSVTPPVARRLAAAALGVGLAGLTPGAALPAAAATSPAPLRLAPVSEPAEAGVTEAPRRPDLVRDAQPESLTQPTPGQAPSPGALSPGWTPDRPAEPLTVRRQPPVHVVTGVPRAPHTVLEEVVVHRGDSLWQIAARALGPAATVAEIAAEWPRWHNANRSLIGADPDLILPGQRLRPP